MPVIKSAIKKLRKDIKRTKVNDKTRHELDLAINVAKKTKTSKTVSKATSLIDRAVKKNLLHKNTAARIKSSLSKLARPLALKRSDSERAKPAAKSPKSDSKSTAEKAKPTKPAAKKPAPKTAKSK